MDGFAAFVTATFSKSARDRFILVIYLIYKIAIVSIYLYSVYTVEREVIFTWKSQLYYIVVMEKGGDSRERNQI